MNTLVRCFRRIGKGDIRCGVWVYTQPDGPNKSRGAFFHGSHNEVQAPYYSIDTMIKGKDFCEEITPEEAIEELASWPEGQDEMRRIFARHPKEV